MDNTPSLWACCILPGCKQPVAEELTPCDTCRDIFGPMLQEADRPPRYTVADLADRDAEIKALLNKAGKAIRCGLICHSALPSAMMLPQLGMLGGVPAPMKDRTDSRIIAEAQT